jgi:hypothetical protein
LVWGHLLEELVLLGTKFKDLSDLIGVFEGCVEQFLAELICSTNFKVSSVRLVPDLSGRPPHRILKEKRMLIYQPRVYKGS